jgi:hypothetical protein
MFSRITPIPKLGFEDLFGRAPAPPKMAPVVAPPVERLF